MNKREVEHYFNRRVKPKSFRIGDLVLKEMETATQEERKLDPGGKDHM